MLHLLGYTYNTFYKFNCIFIFSGSGSRHPFSSMDRIRINTQVSVKKCSLCQGDTEYYCFQCHQDLCNQCKKIHVIALCTKNHNVTSYLERTKYPQKGVISNDNCESSSVISLSSVEYSCHDEERRKYSGKIHNLRSEILYDRYALLEELGHDVKSGYKEVTFKGQLAVDMRGQGLKDLIDSVLAGDLVDRCIIQKTRISRYVTKLERFENRYLKYLDKPVKFLRFLKQKHSPQKYDKKILNMVFNLMKGMQIRRTKHRRVGNEILVRPLFSPVLQICLSVTGIDACRHISCVTPDQVWVSDDNKLVLTDTTTGDNLYTVKDSWHSDSGGGVHTVNNDFELIYINKNKEINKLSKDMKKTITFIRNTDSKWSILSLYFSSSTGDLLVGMFTVGEVSKINVYSHTGCLTRTMSQEYSWPRYITKNNNGDVVVSDSKLRAVIVTSGQGCHRFSYKGSGFQLWPRGICTDAMSHILVCDEYTKTVQMIGEDGEFLSYLLTYRSPGRSGLGPNCLSYDVNNHILFVGQWGTNKMFIYKSDIEYLALNGKHDLCIIGLINQD